MTIKELKAELAAAQAEQAQIAAESAALAERGYAAVRRVRAAEAAIQRLELAAKVANYPDDIKAALLADTIPHRKTPLYRSLRRRGLVGEYRGAPHWSRLGEDVLKILLQEQANAA